MDGDFMYVNDAEQDWETKATGKWYFGEKLTELIKLPVPPSLPPPLPQDDFLFEVISHLVESYN